MSLTVQLQQMYKIHHSVICFPDLYTPQGHMLHRKLLIPQDRSLSHCHSEEVHDHVLPPKVTSPESLPDKPQSPAHPFLGSHAKNIRFIRLCVLTGFLQFFFILSQLPSHLLFSFRDYFCVYLITMALLQSGCKLRANKD